MAVVGECKPPSVLRLEFDVYPGEDSDGGYLWVAMDLESPFDEFERTREAFKAVMRHIAKQLRNEKNCPYHPDNYREGMGSGYCGA